MPRKTKKQKLLAQNRPKQLPANNRPDFVLMEKPVENMPEIKKQLPLIPSQKQKHVVNTIEDTEVTSYFRHDLTKTAILTSLIIVIEIILYNLMNSGMLDKWIPTLKI